MHEFSRNTALNIRFLGRMLNDTKWNRTCRKAGIQEEFRIAKGGERGVNFVNFNDYPVLGFIQALDPRTELHNESPEAEFTLQRDATNDRVTIVSEDPPRFFFLLLNYALRIPPPPSCPSSSHDKSRMKKKEEEKKKEELDRNKEKFEDTVSSLASTRYPTFFAED